LLLRSAVLLVLAAGCATAPPPRSLPAEIDAIVDRAPFDRAFWSILAEEEDGRVLFARNAGKLTIPASNRKLFVSAAVAECLGITSRLTTTVWRDGDDLVVRGDADPSLGSWRYERDGDFDRVARALRARGVTRVRDVVADVSLFDRVTFPGGWKYGNLGEDYAAPVDAIAWGENEVPVDRAVPDAGLHAATALRDALLLAGVEVTGAPRVNVEPRVFSEKLAEIPSPFIGQLLGTVLKNSHNLYAEMLLKRLADAPATYDAALAVERGFLTGEVGSDGGGFRFVDGSGLAPDDLVTPRETIRILRWMDHPSRRAFWWDVLAQPNGEGTLRRRLVTLEHRLRGKTGTINGVAALSGIVLTEDGRRRYFSVAVNHHTASGSADAIDAVVSAIAGW
jgi:D-alanyl-D-alanine carboxypeptidase/D-alanyl-D-alanine-endopeptidase (penicillin-binding protein 4)